jgi:plasmid stability protein
MANLKIKDIDDRLYQALKSKAKSKHRSINQEVLRIIEDYLNHPEDSEKNATEQFLALSWNSCDEESADDLIRSIKKDRTENNKNKGSKNVFDPII